MARTNKIDPHNEKPLTNKARNEDVSLEQHSLTNLELPAVSVSESETVLYKDLPPVRQSRAKNYICTLEIIENEADDIDRLQKGMAIPRDKFLDAGLLHELREEEKGEEIYYAEEEKKDAIQNAKREYEKAVKAAAEKAEQLISRISARAQVEIESLIKTRKDNHHIIDKAEKKIDKVKADAKDARTRKQELEQAGGFQLGLDVGTINERKRKRETES
jgi:hypothetical protein